MNIYYSYQEIKGLKKIVKKLYIKINKFFFFFQNLKIKKVKGCMERIILNPIFIDFIFFCVLSNTLILILDGVVSESVSNQFKKLNFAYTIIYTVELSMKLIVMDLQSNNF